MMKYKPDGCPVDPEQDHDWQVGDEFWNNFAGHWARYEVTEINKSMFRDSVEILSQKMEGSHNCYSNFALLLDKNSGKLDIPVLRIPRIEPPVLTREILEKTIQIIKDHDLKYKMMAIATPYLFKDTAEPIEEYLLRECVTVTPKGSYSHFPLPNVYHSTHCPDCHREACMCERDEEPTSMLKAIPPPKGKLSEIEVKLAGISNRMGELKTFLAAAKDDKGLKILEETELWMDNLIDYFYFRAEMGPEPEDDQV